MQRALTGTWVIWVLNHLYLAAQLVVVPGALVFLYRRSRPIYERLRNTILATWLISIPVYAAFPVAPPRLAGIGMVDTITTQTGFAMDSKLTTSFYNQLAAVPSLHVGFAVAVGIAVAAAVRNPVAHARAAVGPDDRPRRRRHRQPLRVRHRRRARGKRARLRRRPRDRPRAARAAGATVRADAAPGVRRGLSGARALLAVVLDRARVADLRAVRVDPGVAARAALAEEVPAAVELDRDLLEPAAVAGERVLVGGVVLLAAQEAVLLVDEGLDAVQDGLVGHEPTVHDEQGAPGPPAV